MGASLRGWRRSSQIIESVNNPEIILVYCDFHRKTSFHSDDNLLAPALPPSGAGAHCDVSELPSRKISARLCTGNTALSQPRMPWRRGRSPKERHNYYQMFSAEQKIFEIPVVSAQRFHKRNAAPKHQGRVCRHGFNPAVFF